MIKASDVERITGVSQVCVRGYRRHGYIDKLDRDAVCKLFIVAQLPFIRLRQRMAIADIAVSLIRAGRDGFLVAGRAGCEVVADLSSASFDAGVFLSLSFVAARMREVGMLETH